MSKFYIQLINKKGETQCFALPARHKVIDVARILGVSTRTVYRMINSGKLVDTKYCHMEHDFHVMGSELYEYIKNDEGFIIISEN